MRAHNARISSRRMLSIERVGGAGEGGFALDLNSLSRSEISINLFRAIWEAVSGILTFERLTLFRGDEDLAVSSGVVGYTDMPGTTAGGIDHLLLSLPTDMPTRGPLLGQNMIAFIYVEQIGNLAYFWNGGTRCRKEKIRESEEIESGARTDLVSLRKLTQ